MIGVDKWSVLALAMGASLSCAAHAAETISSVTYACDSGQDIVVRYDDSIAEAPTATLDYKGRSFEMYSVPTQSGRRFATEQGLTPERGLQWMTTDDGAVLNEYADGPHGAATDADRNMQTRALSSKSRGYFWPPWRNR